jgi:hypothetical protein
MSFAPKELLTKSMGFAVDNSIFALGGSIILQQRRQNHKSQQSEYNLPQRRIDGKHVMGIEK